MTNNEAARWLRLHKGIFDFCSALADDYKFADKMAFVIFSSLNDAKRLLLVEVPQFILVTTALISVSPEGRCENMTDDTLCLLSACQNCLKAHGLDKINMSVRYVKIGLLALVGVRFLFSAIAYPFLRFMIARKFKDCSGPIARGSIRSYCGYLIDKRVTDLLHETKGSVAPDFFEKASRKSPAREAKEALPMAEVVMPHQIDRVGSFFNCAVHLYLVCVLLCFALL